MTMTVRAHLQLERFRLQSLHIEYNEEWLSRETVGSDRMDDYSVTPDFQVLERTDDGGDPCGVEEILVAFSIHCEPASDDTPTRFSLIHIEIWGLFSLSEETPPEHVDRLKLLNSVAILHGIARGQVIQATGSCVDGPFMLPSVNYVASSQDTSDEDADVEEPACHVRPQTDGEAAPPEDRT
jgi:hypothetical protein